MWADGSLGRFHNLYCIYRFALLHFDCLSGVIAGNTAFLGWVAELIAHKPGAPPLKIVAVVIVSVHPERRLVFINDVINVCLMPI